MKIYHYLQKKYGNYEFMSLDEAAKESLLSQNELKKQLKVYTLGVKMWDVSQIIEKL